jgi:hypothetical protein
VGKGVAVPHVIIGSYFLPHWQQPPDQSNPRPSYVSHRHTVFRWCNSNRFFSIPIIRIPAVSRSKNSNLPLHRFIETVEITQFCSVLSSRMFRNSSARLLKTFSTEAGNWLILLIFSTDCSDPSCFLAIFRLPSFSKSWNSHCLPLAKMGNRLQDCFVFDKISRFLH